MQELRIKQYSVGQLVWRFQKQNCPGRKAKIARHWSGPWIIVSKFSDVLFKIQHARNAHPVVVHDDNIKEYRGSRKITLFLPKQEEISINRAASFPILDDFQLSKQEHEARDIQLETAQPLLSDLPSTNSEQHVDSDQQIPLNESKPEVNTPISEQQCGSPLVQKQTTSTSPDSSEITEGSGLSIPDPKDANLLPDPSRCIYKKRRCKKSFKTKQMLKK